MTHTFHHDHLPDTAPGIFDRAGAHQSGLLQVFTNWARRQRQIRDLRQLMALDNRLLSDIGVSRQEVQEQYLHLTARRRFLLGRH